MEPSGLPSEPPLTFDDGIDSARFRTILGHFAVNILGEHQEDTCRRFGAKAGDRFEGVGWDHGKTGSPILHEAIAYVDCVIDAEHDAGDHMIVVGRVVDVGLPAEGGPLLFWRGGYGRLGQ